MTQFLDTRVDKSLGATGAWTDIDLSSDIPTNATGAIFRVYNVGVSNDYKYGLRKKGSTDERYERVEPQAQITQFIGVDSNRKCQGKIENTSVDFKLVGYTEGDATFFTNGIDKSISTWDTWEDIDLSANLPSDAVAAIFEVHNTHTAPRKYALRKKGSTDERFEDACWKLNISFIVGVDGNRKCQGKIETSSVDFYLIGYLTSGTAETNGVDRSLGTTGSYIDITESNAPSGSTGVFVEIKSALVPVQHDYRKNGASYTSYYKLQCRHPVLAVGLDSNKKWEGKIENTGTDFYTLFYFAPGVAEVTKESSGGISVQETKTKTSSAGISIQETKTKASSGSLTVLEHRTKESSAGLTIFKKIIKESSASLSVSAEGEKVSSGGLRIVTRFTKESSAGLSIHGGAFVVSSGGLAISEKKTKVSSAGISISEPKTKESSAGIRIINQTLKESSASLTVKAAYTKESTAGMSIVAQQTKQSSASLTVSGKNTLISSGSLTISEAVLKKGLFYAKLGNTILETVMPENFRISKEINKIPSFEFEVANTTANKAAIAADITSNFKIYWQHHGADTHIFTGIINADGIEYISLSNIRISGFASYVKLGWPLYKHLDAGDAEPVNIVLDYNGTYTDYTFYANNATINDVPATFGGENHCFYVGENNPFWGLQVKYSTPGIPAGSVVVIEFSKGGGVWESLHVLDETNAFTEDAGTYDIIIPHPPSDWARNAVGGDSKFWIRWRVVSGAYTTAPKLDQIHTVNVDVYRVFYYETSAREILLDVLEGTEYSMDAIDECPEDEINIWAEYESPLRIIAAIPAALTWTDTDGSKKSYQWWIDEAKKVHIKQKRGSTYSDDITGDLTIFNNLVDYFNISNRLFGFSRRDGLSQIRAIIEDKASQATHSLREIAVPKNEIGKYLTLKESLEKDIAFSKNPMQRLKGAVTTEFWGQRGYDVGDTVTLHQGEWVVDEGEFQIVKVDIGPILTQLNLGVSREHLEGLKSNLKRSFDLNNIQMHGSTSLLSAGPETGNYERKSDGSVFASKLKIEIPSTVKKTHKVLLSWTIGPYRASVNDQSGDVPPHDHGGNALIGGGIDSDFTDEDGGHTPDMELDGLHTPAMINGLHKHKLEGAISYAFDTIDGRLVTSDQIADLNHRHTQGASGTETQWELVVHNLIAGTECAEGSCIQTQEKKWVADALHTHANIGLYTGYTTPPASIYVSQEAEFMSDVQWIYIDIYSALEAPVHEHTGEEVAKHDHVGVEEPDHLHGTPEVFGHIDHGITGEAGYTVSTNYGIHEEAAGTVLELLVNSEKIGEYSGAQAEIRIDGYLTSGTNTIEIQPVAAETGKKGSATILATGILFIEPKKF